MRWLPNLLTCVRILLTPLIVYRILTEDCETALPLAVFAGLTDAADGYLARRLRSEGRLGAWLDPIADKLLLTALYIAFGASGLAPVWLVWLVVGRDVLILGMAAFSLVLTPIRDFPPTIWGKISTVAQIGGAVIILCACAGFAVPGALLAVTIPTVAGTTVWSGFHYTWSALRQFREWRRTAGAG